MSARNALKHGLRARQAVRPEDLPNWIRAIEANLVNALDQIGQERRENLDRLLSLLVLLDRTDRLIAEQFGRWHAALASARCGGEANFASLAEEIDVATMRKLIRYRRRFRAERDLCLRRIIAPVTAVATAAALGG